jgi:Pyruvate/2-oxoacid:ferredoxin oxidoreductase gamma subunit
LLITGQVLAETVGSNRAVNIILYGYFVGLTQMFRKEDAQRTLQQRLGRKKEFADMNNQAFALDWERTGKGNS